MREYLVYDLPTRLFHWFFAGLFVTAFFIAKTIDDDSPIYVYHMLAGFMLCFLVILRLLWGFIGTKHARLFEFALHPKDLFSYFKGLVTGDKKLWAGHNPASSWSSIIMIFFAIGLGLTGYFMTSGTNKEDFEDIHELFANGFIIVVILHIAGLIFHTFQHREMIALSMIDGKKSKVINADVIPSAKSNVAVIMILLVVGFGYYLLKNFSTQSKTLQFFGTSLQLGENEESEAADSINEKKETDKDEKIDKEIEVGDDSDED